MCEYEAEINKKKKNLESTFKMNQQSSLSYLS